MKKSIDLIYVIVFLSLNIIVCDKENLTEPASPPSAPNGISASAGNGKITIIWSSVTGSTSYNLYWATTPGVTPETGTQVRNVTCPYTHTELVNGTTYYYIVVAVNEGGESSASDEVSATPVAPPAKPIDVSAIAGNWEVTISWPSMSAAGSYNLYWATASGVNPINGTLIQNVTSPYTHTGLINGTTYYYIVVAVNEGGESLASDEVSAVPFAPPESGKWSGRSGGITVHFTVSTDRKSVSKGEISASCGSIDIYGPVSIENSKFTLLHSDGINFISAEFTDVDEAYCSYGLYKGSHCWAFGTMICTH
ncbi:hypothetical protein JW998_08925 [candidate division KSB1 bacterium]|nr:hypothetical protein [candidate division KSB1 bacterium]